MVGFSMIELLLALALGVVVVAGIVQLFIGNSQTYSLLTGQSRLQENGRFALDFIERSVRSAGFMGCAPERVNMVRGLRGVGLIDNWQILFDYDMTRFIEGVEGDGGFDPGLAVLPTTSAMNVDSANVDTVKANSGIDPAVVEADTDVLVVRQVEGGARLLQTLQPLGNPVVRAPGGDPGFGVNDVVMVSDCEQGAVFRVTGMNVAGNQATLLHATGNTGDFFENGEQIESPTGQIDYTLSYLGRSYGEEAVIGEVVSTTFFVADSIGTNNAGDTPLSLWRRTGAAQPVELIQGIEDLDVLYGIDTTPNDGVSDVNQYVTFPNVPDVDQIVAVRVSVTANSIDVVANQGDGVLRQTFTQTILVRNANPAA
jgi:type IV pilus assembly protein PilW